MFRRLVFEHSAALFTITAFFTAASIYATFAWRALRMKRPQTEHFENLPFATPTPSAWINDGGVGRPRPTSNRQLNIES
jgi:hypothetical protein